MTNHVVVQRGRQCPHCKVIAADPDDQFCVTEGCDYQFPPDAPVVGLDADGVVVEINGKPAWAAPLAPQPVLASVPALQETVASPAVVASPVVAPVATALEVRPAHTKVCTLEARVDLSPRDGRPEEGDPSFKPAPSWQPTTHSLTAPVVDCGRVTLGAEDILIQGDAAVSRSQARFRRRSDGGFDIENLSNNGTFIRTTGQLLEAVGARTKLNDGDEIEVGYWTTLVYRETEQTN
jgi:hypothetical protein